MVLMQAALNHEISLIGAPTDVGGGQPGARQGPQALRAAGLAAAVQALGWRVHDSGDLHGPANPQQPSHAGYRHLAEVSAWSRVVHDAVASALTQGRLPLLLGGDHSLAIGSISAAARHCRAVGRHLRVLWLDAHADCNSRRTSPSANLHGMPLACLRGVGPGALTQLSGQVPALEAADVRLMGVRSIDPGEVDLVHQLGLTVFDMTAVRTLGMREVMTRALAGVDEHTHLHVSFDVDVLDPGIAPGVATTVRDGIGLRDAQEAMAMIAATGRLASLDVMELNPTLDPHQRTAALTVQLLATLLNREARPSPPTPWPAAPPAPPAH